MIRLFAMDVDGTLTDGGIYIGASGEFKCFNAKDGLGIVKLRQSGVTVAIVSGRYSPATEARARDLGIDIVANGTGDKLKTLVDIAEKLGVSAEEVAYIGDDTPDIECMKWAGIGMAVADASSDVLDAADWTSERGGGHGAVRDAAEHVLCLNRR